jgi:GT2 family glycosyltransferase/CMP-N-acetylneuraminic acid synthetase
MPEISIIVRTYNEEKWIGQCLRAVQTQTIDDIEVILVDNLSTDKTVKKAEHIYPELTLIEIDDYMPGLALNEGIRASEGEYFVCLSAHCVPVDDNWLENLRRNFAQEKNIAGVYGRQVPVESSDPVDKRDLLRTFGPERRVQEQDTFFHNANSMVRREVWEEHLFKEDVTNIEDQIWGNEVINADYKLVYEPDAAVYHYHGINQGNDEDRTKSVIRIMENHEIRPDEHLGSEFEGNPLDPTELDIVSFVPVRHQAEVGVDFDESLVTRTIDAANDTKYVDDIILLTDSDHIAERGERWGASVPFLRPPELSERDVEVVEVFQWALDELERDGRFPDLVMPLEVTHPFRPPGMLDKLVTKLVTEGFDTVVTTFPEFRPCWLKTDDGLERINEDTTFRVDRDPLQIGLVSLGCITYPRFIRDGNRVGGDVGVHEVENPLAAIEIRQRDDLKHWEQLRDLDTLFQR